MKCPGRPTVSMISRCSLGRTIFLHSRIEGEARGTLTYSHNFKHGDSARFNAEDNALFSDVTITFTDTELTLGGSPATAVVRNFIGHHNSNH